MKRKYVLEGEWLVTIRGDVYPELEPFVVRQFRDEDSGEYEMHVQLPLSDKDTRWMIASVLAHLVHNLRGASSKDDIPF
jgi:hypothetical protein